MKKITLDIKTLKMNRKVLKKFLFFYDFVSFELLKAFSQFYFFFSNKIQIFFQKIVRQQMSSLDKN